MFKPNYRSFFALTSKKAHRGFILGTYFFVDPQEELIGILMTQIRPYSHLKIRRQFQILATTAIEESFAN